MLNGQRKREYTQKERKKGLKLPDKPCSDLAYICGILVGDGSIYGRKKKHEYFIKCVGNPKDEKELYHEIIAPRFANIFGFVPEMGYHDQNTTYGFSLYSKTLYTYLTDGIGLLEGRKDSRLSIPKIFKEDKKLIIPFLRGLFDTDGCISFKKRYKLTPYYPTIIFSSKSEKLTAEIAQILKQRRFKVVEIYNYKLMDNRVERGFTIINRLEMNGKDNLRKWLDLIGFDSPKHLNKIKENWEGA
ncbi:hypothetical protein KY359_01995 [Candidatus Woesearchaeota archaeon]|nr:hypothetical protein [Candidatus Woesearchaeota archaeon]